LPTRGDGATLPPGGPIAVKEAVLPWARFSALDGSGLDIDLGPEMRSTGEVMAIDMAFGTAFAKSQAAAQLALPTKGRILVSVTDRDKRTIAYPMRVLADLGFDILATSGTAAELRRNGIAASVTSCAEPGLDPAVLEQFARGEIDLVVSTMSSTGSRLSGRTIRAAAIAHGVPCLTTVQALAVAAQGINALRTLPVGVRSLQEFSQLLTAARGRPSP
jgi:carbamoyl-phosphate synthase large subunit